MHVVRRVRQGGGTEGGQNGAGGGATAEVLAEQDGGRESGRNAGRHGRRRPAHLADGRLLRPDPRADLPQQRGVVGVTGHARGDATTNRAAEQVEVAEDVEDLVAYELVGEA